VSPSTLPPPPTAAAAAAGEKIPVRDNVSVTSHDSKTTQVSSSRDMINKVIQEAVDRAMVDTSIKLEAVVVETSELRAKYDEVLKDNVRLLKMLREASMAAHQLTVPENMTSSMLMTKCFAKVIDWSNLYVREEVKSSTTYAWSDANRDEHYNAIWRRIILNKKYICVSYPQVVHNKNLWMRCWGMCSSTCEWIFLWVSVKWNEKRVVSDFYHCLPHVQLDSSSLPLAKSEKNTLLFAKGEQKQKANLSPFAEGEQKGKEAQSFVSALDHKDPLPVPRAESVIRNARQNEDAESSEEDDTEDLKDAIDYAKKNGL